MGDKKVEYFGQGGRLHSKPLDALIESAYAHECKEAPILLPGLHKADLSHAVMLIEKGIIPKKEGMTLLKGLLSLEEIPVDSFPIDPALGDVYNSKDNALAKQVGDVSGWLHVGRARREAVNIGYLLAVRERLLSCFNSLLSLLEAFLIVAKRERYTIMPDFTYLHHAHPTNLGHYLLTFAYPMLRDLERLKAAYVNTNKSPAGSGSVNGSRLPLDRERLSELLCFDGLAYHARDAMWQVDVPMETLSAVSTALVNINRFADELQIWNTAEFNMVDLPDSLCRASVIMPQKKNPYPLAYIRGVAGQIAGQFPSFASYGKITSGNPDSRMFIYGDLPRALDQGTGAIRLMTEIVRNLQFKTDVMADRVTGDYSYATDLAEHILLHHKLDYRTCHNIVGFAIREMVKDRIPGSAINARLINEASQTVTGRSIDINDEEIAEVVNGKNIVASRLSQGGASRPEMDVMFQKCEQHVVEQHEWFTKQEKGVNYHKLNAAINTILRESND